MRLIEENLFFEEARLFEDINEEWIMHTIAQIQVFCQLWILYHH